MEQKVEGEEKEQGGSMAKLLWCVNIWPPANVHLIGTWGPGGWLSWDIYMGNSPASCEQVLQPFPWWSPSCTSLFFYGMDFH